MKSSRGEVEKGFLHFGEMEGREMDGSCERSTQRDNQAEKGSR